MAARQWALVGALAWRQARLMAGRNAGRARRGKGRAEGGMAPGRERRRRGAWGRGMARRRDGRREEAEEEIKG